MPENFCAKNGFSGKIPESGFRVPNRELCLLLGSAHSALIVPNCGPLRGFMAKVRANCAQLSQVFGGFLFEIFSSGDGVGLKCLQKSGFSWLGVACPSSTTVCPQPLAMLKWI